MMIKFVDVGPSGDLSEVTEDASRIKAMRAIPGGDHNPPKIEIRIDATTHDQVYYALGPIQFIKE